MKSAFGVSLLIKRETIENLFISACEGGSNYWCKEIKPKGGGDAYAAMFAGFIAVDGESEKKINVTPTKIKKAVQLMAAKEPRHFADVLGENEDATTGDVFLQLCCFGKVIYG